MDTGSVIGSDFAPQGLFLTVRGVGDRGIFADPRATVADLVRGLGGEDSDVLVVARTGRALLPTAVLGLSDLRSGDVVEFDRGRDADTIDLVMGPVTLRLQSGPRAGEEFPLPPGDTTIGRAADNDLVIIDPGVSRHHATFTVDSASVTVADSGSTNGVLVGDDTIDGPIVLESGQKVLIGHSWVEVWWEMIASGDKADADLWDTEETAARRALVTPGTSPYNPYTGQRIVFPAPPERNRGWLRSQTEGFEAAANLYDRSLQSATAALVKELDIEWTARLAEAPSTDELMEAVVNDVQVLWPRLDTDPLMTRIGLAALPSRVVCSVPVEGDEELRTRAEAVVEQYRTVDGVPVTVDFSQAHSVLVAGHEEESRGVSYGLLGQLAMQHQPNRLRIWALLDPANLDHWSWLKWLPHCDGFTNQGTFSQLTADPAEYPKLVERLAASANGAAQRANGLGPADGPTSAVLLIDGSAQIPNEVQAAIESLVAGPNRSDVVALVVGQSDPNHQLELPFGQKGTVVIVNRDYASLETVIDATDTGNWPAVLGIDFELCTVGDVGNLARSLAWIDALPAASSTAVRTATPAMFWDNRTPSSEPPGLDEVVRDADPAIVVERWAETPVASLNAVIGRGSNGPLTIDLRQLGPHALVSGDLEGFLPAWVATLAAGRGPNDLNFYLIDSTGGSVFRHCRELPHTIGNLSDTSTLEIKPALAMLSAELDRRESVLGSVDCHSIEELERQDRDVPFPYLVVAIDRVEALGATADREVDGDGVVTLDPAAELLAIAERGQQLGVHLLLGHYGEIDERLAERIALRIDTARYGASHLAVGDAPVASFRATLASLPPEVVIRSFRIDDTTELSRELLPVTEVDDLERLTSLIAAAHEFSGQSLPSGLS